MMLVRVHYLADSLEVENVEWFANKMTRYVPVRQLRVGVHVINQVRPCTKAGWCPRHIIVQSSGLDVSLASWVNVMFWIAVSSACVFLNVLVTSAFSCLLQNGVVSGLCGSPGLNDSFRFQRVAQPAPLPHCWRRQTNSLTLKLICQQRVLCRRRAA